MLSSFIVLQATGIEINEKVSRRDQAGAPGRQNKRPLLLPSCSQASGNFLRYALFQTVFVNAGFLYTGQISHKLPAGLLVFIIGKSPVP